jgi:hypothetical protein
MAQQTTYLNNPVAGIAGMVSRFEGNVIETKIASGSVPVGMLAVPGTQAMTAPGISTVGPTLGDPGTVAAFPTGASITDNPLLDSEFIGVPIYDASVMQSSQYTSITQGSNVYSAWVTQMAVAILRKGHIWVYTDAAVTQYTDVFIYNTNTGNFLAGQFAAASGANRLKLARARWMMTTTAAGVAEVEIW